MRRTVRQSKSAACWNAIPYNCCSRASCGYVTGDAHVAFGGVGEVGNDAQQGGLAAAEGPMSEMNSPDSTVRCTSCSGYLVGLTLVEDLPDAVGVDCVLGCRRAHALFSLGRLRVR